MSVWNTNVVSLNGNWTSVAYGNLKFVGVGNSGDGIRAIVSVDNGKSWSVSTTPSYDWRSVTFGNNLFVAISYDGYCMSSPDGVTWTLGGYFGYTGFVSVCYGLGLYVAVNNENILLARSYDGSVWVIETDLLECSSICFGNNQFVAIGKENGALTSSDGVNWSLQTQSNSASWSSIAYGNGLYVATQNFNNTFIGSSVVISSDGITWTLQSTIPEARDNQWSSICYDGSQFIAVDKGFYGVNSGSVMTSPDGLTWTLQITPGQTFWTTVTSGNGVIVALGINSYSEIMTSSDGVTWTLTTYYPYYLASSICYGMVKKSGKNVGGLLVSTSSSLINNNNYISTSHDGINWNAVNVSTELNSQLSSWYSVCAGEYNDNSLFVAVGRTRNNIIMTSPDGITWTLQNAKKNSFILSVCYGDGLFVAVGIAVGSNTSLTPNFITSVDGITWTAGLISSTLLKWNSVCYGNDLFVAVGENNVATTSDGVTWNCQDIPNAENLSCVCFGSYESVLGFIVNIFVAVGNNCLYTSEDGITWVERILPVIDNWVTCSFGSCRKKGSGTFVVLSSGRAITSVDGVTWIVMESATDNGWVSVCYAPNLASINNYFVAVSNQGMVTMSAKDTSCVKNTITTYNYPKNCCKTIKN